MSRTVLVVAVALVMAVLVGGQPAHATVATTAHRTPTLGVAGVTFGCGPSAAYACTGGGYGAASSKASGWPWTLYGGANASNNSYGPHNCTLYAAFRLAQNGVGRTTWSANANGWALAASRSGIPVDQTPAVGSIAQWNTGAAGHVAYVESVDATGIVISEDNYMPSTGSWAGGYTARIRIAKTSAAWPDNFIHFKDLGPDPSTSLQLVHFWKSGSGRTDVNVVTPSGVTSAGVSAFGAVAPGNGQFGLGDFNFDGIPDLYLTVTQGDPSGRSAVFVAAGPSYTTLLTSVVTPMGQFTSQHGQLVVNDFTGDGRADVGIVFANNGQPNAAFGVLDAATNFQSWSFLSSIPIGGHDGARSNAIAGDFNADGSTDFAIGFHQGTPSGNVDLFVLDGARSWQAQLGSHTLPLGNYADGAATLISGRFGTTKDTIGVVYYEGTPNESPNLFTLNGFSTVNGAWALPVPYVPSSQRIFIGR